MFYLYIQGIGDIVITTENDGRSGIDPVFITATFDLDPADEPLIYEIVDNKNKRHTVTPQVTNVNGKQTAVIEIRKFKYLNTLYNLCSAAGDDLPIAVRVSAANNPSIYQEEKVSFICLK